MSLLNFGEKWEILPFLLTLLLNLAHQPHHHIPTQMVNRQQNE